MPNDFSEELKSANKAVKDISKSLNDAAQDFNKAIKDIGKSSSLFPKTWDDVTKKIKGNLPIIKELGDLEKKLEAGKKKQSADENTLKQSLEKRKGIESSIANIEKEQQKIKDNSLAWKLGDQLTTSQQEAYDALEAQKNEFKGINSELEKQEKSIGESIESEKKKNKEIEKSINAYTAVVLVLNLTKDAILGLIKLGETYDKVLMGFAHSLGVGRIEAEKYVPALTASAQKSRALGASLVDAAAAATQLVNQFELMATSALEDVNQQMLVLNKAFGVSLEDGAKFYSTLTQVGNASLSSQTNMTGVADAAAKAAGVPLGKVIKDVANTTDSVRLIFKGNTEQLIKQAAEARKLGTNLESAAKSAESLLNFETSVGAELKLSALLGKSVNFNESRRLFFAGKILEGEKAILAELSKIGDINDLNYLQRKALSDATGKSISELQKMQSQSKQQLDLDSRFPELAKERREEEEKLNKIMASTEAQRERALEMQARDNIANARANVFLKQKEQILLNLSRAIQPFYRALTDLSEKIMEVAITFSNWMADMSAEYPNIAKWGPAIGIVIIGAVGLAAAIGALILTLAGLSAIGLEISAFLIEVGAGLFFFGAAGLEAVPIVLSIAAGLAALGLALWALGEAFEGFGSLVRAIFEPFVKYVEIIVTGFNTFISNIGSAMINIGNGLKTIADIGFFKLSKAAAGVAVMAKSITDLGIALASFPTDKLAGFTANISGITNTSVASLNKLSELFQSAVGTGGKLMIGIEEEAVASINKLAELKGEREELKQTIREGNDRLVKSIETLTSMMANGGIAVNLDGQRLNAGLSKTTYRSGGFGQATSLV